MRVKQTHHAALNFGKTRSKGIVWLSLLLLWAPVHSAFGAGDLTWFESYELGWGQWYTDAGVWELGEPVEEPNAAYHGRMVAATNLSGKYPANTDSRLISPVLTLPTVSGSEKLQLRFWQWYSYAGYDTGYVQVSTWDGSAWTPWTTIAAPTAPGTNSPWSPVAVDLTPHAGQIVQIAFYHTAASPHESLGWYIDSVSIWKGTPSLTYPLTFAEEWEDTYTDCGVWEIGRSSVVPPSPVSGGNCAGTVLNGRYPAQTESRLILPPVVLPVGPVVQLRFWQWYSYAGYDTGHVQVSAWDGSAWGPWTTVAIPTAPDTNSSWGLIAVNLTPYAGQTVQIAFYHTAASPHESLGWYIDDVEIPGCTGDQPHVVPNPQLVFTGTEDYIANGQRWTRYCLGVTNRMEYPAELFAPAPELPPCGLNPNASRTWVRIFTTAGEYLYGFCALSGPDDLDGIWFAVPQGSTPPATVYITLEDRQLDITYTSNPVDLTPSEGCTSCGS